jgi:hypothetical protein
MYLNTVLDVFVFENQILLKIQSSVMTFFFKIIMLFYILYFFTH